MRLEPKEEALVNSQLQSAAVRYKQEVEYVIVELWWLLRYLICFYNQVVSCIIH